MWQLESSGEYESRLKKLIKTHRQEVKNATDNLAAFFASLNKGLKPQQIIRGYIHNEPQGIIAIDESGPGKHKKAIRLYIYPNDVDEVVHVLTIGDKRSQSSDIKACKESVNQIVSEQEAKREAGY